MNPVTRHEGAAPTTPAELIAVQLHDAVQVGGPTANVSDE